MVLGICNYDLCDYHARSYGNNIVYTDWQKDNYFVAVKEALGNVRGKIGVEFDHLSLENYG